MNQLSKDMLDILRDIDETSEDCSRAVWAHEHDLSLFDFDEWCNLCHILQQDIPYEDVHAMNEYFDEWNDLPEREGKPFLDWDWMSYTEDDAEDIASCHQYCVGRYVAESNWNAIREIVRKQGGFREQKVMSEPPYV